MVGILLSICHFANGKLDFVCIHTGEGANKCKRVYECRGAASSSLLQPSVTNNMSILDVLSAQVRALGQPTPFQ